MSSVKFEPNIAGFNELRRSPEMQGIIRQHAEAASARAGNGYKVKMYPSRAIAVVEAATDEAAQDNLDNNTLLKAVRG